ncbi:MAG TPA: SAM-dependent methyltransferase [Acidimicrobiaceae bacterium]|nr:SAM-dependent methyltransferase [Acidimicrobiaceae bacterium]
MQTPKSSDPRSFWESRYRSTDVEEVSWYEPVPHLSLALLEIGEAEPSDSVIDIGGGASSLAEFLAIRGFTDVTVLDASDEALRTAQDRWSASADVTWIVDDLLLWQPDRTWKYWHDRAVFHFLTDPSDRETYRELLRQAVKIGGVVAIATFAEDGPTMCSGLTVARYNVEQLEAELGSSFGLIASGRYVHHTPSGAEQPLSWVVMRRTS